LRDLAKALASSRHRVRLTQLPDDLLRLVLLAFYRKSSFPSRTVGLSKHVDQLLRSKPSRQVVDAAVLAEFRDNPLADTVIALPRP
jgi:hypothetical protein